MRIAIVGTQLGISICLLKGCEIGPLNVFYDGEFERVSFACINDDYGNFVLSCALRSTPTSFSGDDFVVIWKLGDYSNKHWLDDPPFSNRVGEFIERGVVDSLTWIPRVRPEKLYWRCSRVKRTCGALRTILRRAKEGGKAAAEAKPIFGATGALGHVFNAPKKGYEVVVANPTRQNASR
jgi:hypothetical protein